MRGDVWCKRHKIFAVSAHFCHETWLQYFKMGNDIIFFKLWSEKKSRTLLKSFLVILKTFCFQKMKKLPKMLKENLFPPKKSLHVCKLDHKCLATSKNQKMVRQAKFSISQQHIGPLILGESQIYILTRVNLLYPLCYEIPCIPLWIIFRSIEYS